MDWVLRGKIVRFEPPSALGFTWAWDHEPETPQTEVTVTFDGTSDGTVLRVTHGPYPDTDEGRQMRQVHLDGWMYFLPRLQDVGELD